VPAVYEEGSLSRLARIGGKEEQME
jgi:hypothetical protein